MKNGIGSLLLLLAAVGCGSGDAGGSGAYSCDIKTAGVETCTEESWSGGAYSTDAAKTACTSAGGTAGTACPHTNAVGGCKLTSTAGGITVETTSWYYTGSASMVMSNCTAGGETYVAP